MEDTTRTAELRRKLEKDPGSRLFAQFAEELRKEGRHDEAIAVARKGLESNPNYPSARLTLARSLHDSGRPAEARPELEQVMKASPDNILAGRLLGEVLEELGQFDEALVQLEKTLRFAPGDKAIVERIAGVKARRQSAAAPPPPAPPPPATTLEVLSLFPSAAPAASAPGVAMPALSMPEAAMPKVELPAAAPDSQPPLPALAMPSVPMPTSPPPGQPPSAFALDRDLASGTLSPGSLSVSDLQFGAGPGLGAEPASAPADTPEPMPSFEEPAAIDADPGAEIGAQTLPLTSVTLADLYLQQGLKAEASAVLEQVMKDEPDNTQARSKLDAVSKALEAPAPKDPGTTEPAPPLAPPVNASPAPRKAAARSRAEVRERTILSLKAFQSAIEREALQQRATEQKAF